MIVSQIAAMAKNRVIGADNGLPWDIPEDMKFFVDKTKGKVMVMGRKTFESLGKPLPKRHHIVVTRDTSYSYDHERVEVMHDLASAIDRAKVVSKDWDSNEVIVAGGGEIYKQALPMSDRIYLTIIEEDFSGDTIFPEFESDPTWQRTEHSPRTEPVAFSFNTFERR